MSSKKKSNFVRDNFWKVQRVFDNIVDFCAKIFIYYPLILICYTLKFLVLKFVPLTLTGCVWCIMNTLGSPLGISISLAIIGFVLLSRNFN